MNARPAYADPVEAREQAVQDAQDRLWSDRECFAEYASEVLTYLPRREVTRFSLEGLVRTGQFTDEDTTGLPLIALAQKWHAEKSEWARDEIAAQFGKALLASIEAYIEEVAQEDLA